MAYAIAHFPGGTEAQYEATVAAVHPDRGSTPPQETAFETHNLQP